MRSFFNIDPTEDYPHYSFFLKYEEPGKQGSVVKKLTFKDETATKRGIRIIPRTSAYGSDISYKEAQQKAKDTFDVGGAARIPIPTIYLSISRLYPLGERVDTVTVTQIKKTNKLYQSEADKKFHDWYNYVIPGSIKNGIYKKNVPTKIILKLYSNVNLFSHFSIHFVVKKHKIQRN